VFTARYELKHTYNSYSVNITVHIILSSLLAQATCCLFKRSILWLLFWRYSYRTSSGSAAVLTGLVVFLSQISGRFLNIGHHRFTPGTLKSTNYPTFRRRILQRRKMNHIIIIIIIINIALSYAWQRRGPCTSRPVFITLLSWRDASWWCRAPRGSCLCARGAATVAQVAVTIQRTAAAPCTCKHSNKAQCWRERLIGFTGSYILTHWRVILLPLPR